MWTESGLVACESYAGRVLRLHGGGLTVLGAGLANPSYAVPDGEGGLFVTEFTGSRVSHLAADGTVEALAEVPQPGPISGTSNGDLLIAGPRRFDPSRRAGDGSCSAGHP